MDSTIFAFGGTDFVAGAAGIPLAINLNAALLGKDGVFNATAGFVKRRRRSSVVRTTVNGEDGRLIDDMTTSHIVSK